MQNKEQQALITTVLGAACLGLGGMFTLFPGFMNRAAGFNAAKGPQSNLLIRFVGMRDLAFGVGILTSRNDPAKARPWLNMLTLVTGSDVAVLGLSLPASKNKLLTLFGMLISAAAMGLTLLGSREG